ncbi:hypothetical protein PAXRUDRAFT_825727 [Paxillus rubicundulus Ve08.2h10]|uniref:Uncharacterized protein n=1 Tax=Paxillus rubicundulus Ve08.2h10 TaxID=930991 RepID=A0A0D0DFS8_9AGAM|nr:hypothetical protein PAXRUDRAFT_825727 [Paxillus rubicundulus Ve08.2h10]
MSWEELRGKVKEGVEEIRAHYQESKKETGDYEELSSLINWTQEPRVGAPIYNTNKIFCSLGFTSTPLLPTRCVH